MKKNDLDYLKNRIDILAARIAQSGFNISFYDEMREERSALERVYLKFKELEAEKAELAQATMFLLNLFDRDLPTSSIGKRACNEAREIIEKVENK